MKWRAVLAVTSAAVLFGVASCGEAQSPSAERSEGLIDAGEERGAPEPCRLEAGACIGNCAHCPVTGRRIDPARECVEASMVLACRPAGASCILLGEEGCVARPLEDGGDELFVTPSISGLELTGLAPCDDEQRERAFAVATYCR